MAYLVLARKWRPRTLVEVLGQEHVTRTLRNALASGRIASTFLFSGPRGCGKTSTARIFAKALCCERSEGPTPDPCGTCGSCVAIAEGSSTDVLEIDAATHTGVDHVREHIIETVRYLPSSARYRVFIIDEVHMLSASSFNALLKTFEEPPAHVKFVLATTELHKIPRTVLSRCQRHDFRLVASGRIHARLGEILDAEGIEHDAGGLTVITRLADGSMRDAQSLLEQALSYAGGRRLDAALAREALGVAGVELVEGAFDAIFHRRPDAALKAVAEVHNRGLGHQRFAGSLVEHARDLVVARVMPNPGPLLDRPESEVRALVEQSADKTPEALERLFEQLCRVEEEVARTPQPRYALEVGLVGLAAGPLAVPVPELMAQLDRLERVLRAPGPVSGGRAFPSTAPRVAPAAPRRTGEARPRDARASTLGRAGDQDSGDEPPPRALDRGPVGPTEVQSQASRAREPVPTAEAPEDAYRRFVAEMTRQRPMLGATLHQVRPLAFGPDRVQLACETAFDDDKLASPGARAAIERAIEAFFGRAVRLEVVRARAPRQVGPAARTPTEVLEEERAARTRAREARARSHPAVAAVQRELGATITRVELRGEGQEGKDP